VEEIITFPFIKNVIHGNTMPLSSGVRNLALGSTPFLFLRKIIIRLNSSIMLTLQLKKVR
jgi:hypothetical protein